MNTCEKSFLRSKEKSWKIAHLANNRTKTESIERAVYNHGYSDKTCKKWMFGLLDWVEEQRG